MADDNPRLQAALQKLDEELEEGDITIKGYEKRRTLILSQFVAPQDAPRIQRGGLRVHSPDDSDHPASNDGSRAASLAALTGQSTTQSPKTGTNSDNYPRQVGAVKQDDIPTGGGSLRSASPNMDHPQNHVRRFQERELGLPGATQRSSTGISYDSSVTPKQKDYPLVESSPDASRTQTLVSQNYAFNPDTQSEYGGSTRQSTMLDSQQGFFSDFAGQQRGDPRESYGEGDIAILIAMPFHPQLNLRLHC